MDFWVNVAIQQIFFGHFVKDYPRSDPEIPTGFFKQVGLPVTHAPCLGPGQEGPATAQH